MFVWVVLNNLVGFGDFGGLMWSCGGVFIWLLFSNFEV